MFRLSIFKKKITLKNLIYEKFVFSMVNLPWNSNFQKLWKMSSNGRRGYTCWYRGCIELPGSISNIETPHRPYLLMSSVYQLCQNKLNTSQQLKFRQAFVTVKGLCLKKIFQEKVEFFQLNFPTKFSNLICEPKFSN